MAREKLVLIDGSSYLFRAFHALPPLTTKNGEPTGALFGVVNMLRQILREHPTYVAFVLDSGGKNFRHDLFPQYKANRPPTPPDLKAQIEPMIRAIELLGLPLLRINDVEADDVIGTLTKQAVELDIDVVISSSDKDFAQLVNSQVSLVNTMTQSTLDRHGVIEKFGVPPERITDFLALQGDTVDNIPGVEKCGPKTAAKWLQTFDTLEGVITAADSIPGKVGENLRAAIAHLPLSKQLATIHTDVALPLAVKQLVLREPDQAALREFYVHYEFNAALKELDANSGESGHSKTSSDSMQVALKTESPIPGTNRRNYTLITDSTQWQSWLDQLTSASLFAFDTETTSLDAHQAEVVGISVAIAPGEAAYIPLAHQYPGVTAQLNRDRVLADLKPILENPNIFKVGQHGKYDMHVLANYGVFIQGYRFDTMLESYVLNATATRHDMDSLAAYYLGEKTISYEEVAGKGAKQIGFEQVNIDDAFQYAAEDADITLRLHQSLLPQLEADAKLARVFYDIEMPLVPVLARMERRGMLIDGALLKSQTQTMRTRMQELTLQAYALVGHTFSLDSPKQLQQVLYAELGLPIKSRTPKGQASTNEEALAELVDEHELPKIILDYRTLAKLVGTYTEKLPQKINPRTGRVHTSFHQAAAATGRLSSSDPNLQNIPIRTEEGRQIRTTFIAPPGWKIIAADYSQIELRILAHLSNDPGLLQAFKNNIDVHRATAAEVFGVTVDNVDAQQRRAAKAINFGLMYGMGAHGLSRQLGISRQEAQQTMDRYFARYPSVHGFMESVREKARNEGYVETLFGRRLYLPNIHARNANQRAGSERAAINAPMQGTAADIIKIAMIAVDQWLTTMPDRAAMILQVHDELVLEVREDCVAEVVPKLRHLMTQAVILNAPLEVDIGVGNNWDEAH
jgi:DNA polymerase-1